MFVTRLGLQLSALRQPLRKALSSAAALGAKAVELDARSELRPDEVVGTALREVRNLLNERNLRVSAIQYATRRGYDEPQQLEARLEGTKRAMRMASDLGAAVLINQVGQIPPTEDAARWSALRDVLCELAQYGQRIGVTLATTSGREPLGDQARLLADLPAGTVGINFDPGLLVLHEAAPSDAMQTLGTHVVHFHARDAVRDFALRRGVEVPLGRGVCDFPLLLARLEEFRYQGFLTVARHECPQPEVELGQALDYMKAIMAG